MPGGSNARAQRHFMNKIARNSHEDAADEDSQMVTRFVSLLL